MDNNTYEYFNFWVHSYYIHRNRYSAHGTFAIDLEVFQKEHNVTSFNYPEIKFGTWSKLLLKSRGENEDGIPLYYGLIALQCYAAMQMEHDGVDSEKIYRTRFVKLTGMESVHFLDSCFREIYSNQRIQEVIWDKACKNFMAEGISIFLPARRTNSNRFVQFPKSQVVLNREDLKEYKPIFSKLEVESPILSFNDFITLLRRHIHKSKGAFKRSNNLRTDLSSLEESIRDTQIFNFYCSDWKDTHDRELIRRYNVKQRGYIACVDELNVELFSTSWEPLASSRLPSSEILFFKQGDYQNEYWLQNKLEYDCEFLICYPHGRDLHKIGKALEFSGGKATFVLFDVRKDNLPPALRCHVIDHYPIRLRGINIGHSNIFLFGAGPYIEVLRDAEYSVYLDGQKLEKYPLDVSVPGNYVVRTSSFPNLNFSVVVFDSPSCSIKPIGIGRNLANYMLTDAGNRMEGALTLLIDNLEIEASARNMLERSLGRRFPKHYSELKQRILRYRSHEED